MEMPFAPAKLFYSCAEADVPLLDRLEHHLSVLRHEGQIITWQKRQIAAGEDWQRELDHRLRAASLILLLISPDFLASDYLYGVELQQAMQRHQMNEARVLPILLRPCDWTGTPFENLQVVPRNHLAITKWRNRDTGFAEVAKEIRSTLKTMQRLTISAPSTTLPKIWQIPFARNPFFTGRERVLEQLHTQIQATQATAISQPQAINGLGGIGKTQLAIEYAYRYGQEYLAVLWARAETTEVLNASYIEIAKLLNLPPQGAKEQEVIIHAVKAWLRDKEGWLLILDNVDDLNIVQTFLPTPLAGHLLLTTRTQVTGKFARRLEIDTLDQTTGALLLLRRAGLVESNALFDAASLSDRAIANALSEEMGGLPLALDQAGAYIEETQCGLSDYYRQYQMRRAELLAFRGELLDDHPEPVATTWSLSFEQVERRSSAAADLLRLCAFLAPDAIPEEVLTKGARQLGEALALSGAATYQLDQAVSVLRTYSLLTRDPQTQTLTVHRLVQMVLRESLSVVNQRRWMQCVVQTVNAAFPSIHFEDWPTCERLLPHALVCATWIEQVSFSTPEAARLLNQTGYYMVERGLYEGVESLYKRALAIYEQTLGVSHPDTARCLNNLANLYRLQEMYEEVEPLLKRALTIYEQALGASHPNTARCLNDLAGLYRVQRKYGKAEALYKRALEIKEQKLGASHPDTARSLNNLANFYQDQGRPIEAEALYKRALEIKEQKLGASHPHTAMSLYNLALLYTVQGRYEEAEPLFARALEICEQQLGSEHPTTKAMRGNYAILLEAMQKQKDPTG